MLVRMFHAAKIGITRYKSRRLYVQAALYLLGGLWAPDSGFRDREERLVR